MQPAMMCLRWLPAVPTRQVHKAGSPAKHSRVVRALNSSGNPEQAQKAEALAKAKDTVQRAQFYQIKTIETQIDVLQKAEMDMWQRAEEQLRASGQTKAADQVAERIKEAVDACAATAAAAAACAEAAAAERQAILSRDAELALALLLQQEERLAQRRAQREAEAAQLPQKPTLGE